jgi:hypothetical protein
MIAGTFRRAWETIAPRPGQPFWRLLLIAVYGAFIPAVCWHYRLGMDGS